MGTRILAVLAACLFLPFLGACAAGAGGSTSVSPNLITREMINESYEDNAFDIVRRHRSRWLQRPGPSRLDGSGSAEIQVYLDGTHYGGLRSLQNIAANSIDEIRYMSASDATTRYGTGHAAGAIVIATRRN